MNQEIKKEYWKLQKIINSRKSTKEEKRKALDRQHEIVESLGGKRNEKI